MPTDERILGFSNRWYAEAFRNPQDIVIDGMAIKYSFSRDMNDLSR